MKNMLIAATLVGAALAGLIIYLSYELEPESQRLVTEGDTTPVTY